MLGRPTQPRLSRNPSKNVYEKVGARRAAEIDVLIARNADSAVREMRL